MEGEKQNIFNRIKDFININQDNLSFINDNSSLKEHIKILNNILTDKEVFKGNKIQQGNQSLIEVKNNLENIIELEKNNAKEKINKLIDRVKKTDNFQKIETEDRNSIIRPLSNLLDTIANTSHIATIQLTVTDTRLEEMYNRFIEKIDEPLPDDTPPIPRVLLSIVLSQAKEGFHKIKDENELEDFINRLKQKLEQEIKEGKEIIL